MSFKRYYRLFDVRQIPVYFHWSAVLMFSACFIVIPLFGLPLLFIAIGLFLLLLSHELGHAFFAIRLGCAVDRIEIFPIHGYCYYDEVYSEYEDAIVAWGGVTAQMLLLIPSFLILGIYGNTPFGSVNVLLIIFSYVNALSIGLNLAPGMDLDGTRAWRLIPVYIKGKWSLREYKKKKIYRIK